MKRVWGRAAVMMSAIGASSTSAWADGAFEGLATAIEGAGRTWGPALLVLAALIAGGSIALGSAHAGEKVRNFLIGGLFLVLAVAGGAALVSRLQGLGVQ